MPNRPPRPRTVLSSWLLDSGLLLVALGTLGATHTAAQSPGHRLYAPTSSTSSHLLDRDGRIVHTWNSSFRPGLAAYMKDNGNLLRTIRAGGLSGAGAGGGVQEVRLDGTVVWDFRYNSGGVTSHHDIEPLPNGNVLMIAWETKTRAEAIAAGRNPARTQTTVLPDHIIEVQPTGPTSGTIVWKWHVWDHLIQDFDNTKANFGVVGNNPQLIDINYPTSSAGEFNHCNSVDYDPVRDLVVISARSQNEVWIIDHSTTTEEASGHTGGVHGKGGDLLYRWGNPAAYRQAAPRTLSGQHSAKIIPEGYPGAGNMTIFNNNAAPSSTVMEIVLPIVAGRFVLDPSGVYGPTGATWSYRGNFSSSVMSSTERLPNGNQLICPTNQNRILEVTQAGKVVFDQRLSGFGGPFNATYIERTMWSDRDSLSTTAGGNVAFDLIAGSRFSGDIYVMLGSLSGTNPGTPYRGQTIPLNLDAYMAATLAAPGSPILPGSLGLLDGNGKAQAGLALRAGLASSLAGATMHHAFVVLDGETLSLRHISNAEALNLLP